MWSLELITPPTGAALDRETEVRQQLRLEPAQIVAQQAILDNYITSATYDCESYTDRQLLTATWELWLDSFYEEGIYRCEWGSEFLLLPKPPVASITSLTYVDTNGTPTVWDPANYALVTNPAPTGQRARLRAAYAVPWPSHRYQAAAIKVRFVAGYGSTYVSVPAALRAGMLVDVQASYDGDPDGRFMETARSSWHPFKVSF